MDMNTINKTIEKIAEHKANTSFNESYCKEENLEDRKEEGLGIALAGWADWSGTKIMRVFKAALEDANFHDEAELVQEMLDKYK